MRIAKYIICVLAGILLPLFRARVGTVLYSFKALDNEKEPLPMRALFKLALRYVYPLIVFVTCFGFALIGYAIEGAQSAISIIWLGAISAVFGYSNLLQSDRTNPDKREPFSTGYFFGEVIYKWVRPSYEYKLKYVNEALILIYFLASFVLFYLGVKVLTALVLISAMSLAIISLNQYAIGDEAQREKRESKIADNRLNDKTPPSSQLEKPKKSKKPIISKPL